VTAKKLNGNTAEHGIAADRFAREIVRILKASSSALAAPECQPVRPLPIVIYQICAPFTFISIRM
jgi:hypothetical protein